MLFVALLAIFGNGYQFQKGFDFCLKYDFEFEECEKYEELLLANPKSKHYDDYIQASEG